MQALLNQESFETEKFPEFLNFIRCLNQIFSAWMGLINADFHAKSLWHGGVRMYFGELLTSQPIFSFRIKYKH